MGRRAGGYVRDAPLAGLGTRRHRRASQAPARHVSLHQRPDAAARQPRPNDGRDRGAGRVAESGCQPLLEPRLLRIAESQREGDLRPVPRLVHRESRHAARAPTGRGVEALRGDDGRHGRGPEESQGVLREGRVPLGRGGGEPRGLRRPGQPGGEEPPGRCAGAAGLPGRERALAQLLPDRRQGAAGRRGKVADAGHGKSGHRARDEPRPVLRLPRHATERSQGRRQADRAQLQLHRREGAVRPRDGQRRAEPHAGQAGERCRRDADSFAGDAQSGRA